MSWLAARPNNSRPPYLTCCATSCLGRPRFGHSSVSFDGLRQVALFNRLNLLPAELDVECFDQVVEPFRTVDSNDWCAHVFVVQAPGKGDLRHGDSLPFGDDLDRVDDFLVCLLRTLIGFLTQHASSGLDRFSVWTTQDYSVSA
jgi:hypothetical protein